MQPFLTKQKALKISVFKAFLAEDMGLEEVRIVQTLKFHNAVNLTDQAVKAVFRFKGIGSVNFSQMKNGSSFSSE